MFEKLRRQLGLPELQMYWKAQRDKTNDLCDVWLASNPLRKVLLNTIKILKRGLQFKLGSGSNTTPPYLSPFIVYIEGPKNTASNQ